MIRANLYPVFQLQKAESTQPLNALSADAQSVMRQAFAGMLWSKQYYHYVVKDWLDGDSGQPTPPEVRKKDAIQPGNICITTT